MALPNIINEINTIKSTYLPSIGGNLSGVINFLNTWGDNIGDLGGTVGSNNYRLRLTGGEYGWAESGGVIELFSRSNTGYVTIQAQDGTNSSTINITPNGAFTHNGNNVITSAGGTINGTLVLTKGTNLGNIGSISIANGDWVYPALVSNTSSGFYAISGNSPKQAGEFLCRANKDGTNFIDLRGCPDGTLTWGATHVVRITASWKSGTNWYRKYSDGWIEQGGYVYCGSHGTWLSYHLPFSDTGYYLNANAGEGTSGVRYVSFYSRNTTGAGMYTGDDASFNSANLYWYACGY
jgi:hypothetical protein